MSEEEFKKAMKKTIIFILIMIVVLVILGFVVFNKSGKDTSIFENEEQKSTYQKEVEKINSSNISDEDASKIDGSQEFQTEGENSQSQPANQDATETPEQSPEQTEIQEQTPAQ